MFHILLAASPPLNVRFSVFKHYSNHCPCKSNLFTLDLTFSFQCHFHRRPHLDPLNKISPEFLGLLLPPQHTASHPHNYSHFVKDPFFPRFLEIFLAEAKEGPLRKTKRDPGVLDSGGCPSSSGPPCLTFTQSTLHASGC